jgi:hypothetical protein
MTRFATVALILASLSLPAAGFAEGNLEKAPKAAIAAAAAEDAIALPAVSPTATEREARERKVSNRMTPRGSSQSAADFRFTTPYAYPPQTLPLAIPSLGLPIF